jgi:hypothetical protein
MLFKQINNRYRVGSRPRHWQHQAGASQLERWLCGLVHLQGQLIPVDTMEYYRGKYHCTIDLLFDWFGISCMNIYSFCFYLQNRLILTSQTGGQWYSNTFPLEFPADTFKSSSMLIYFYTKQDVHTQAGCLVPW